MCVCVFVRMVYLYVCRQGVPGLGEGANQLCKPDMEPVLQPPQWGQHYYLRPHALDLTMKAHVYEFRGSCKDDNPQGYDDEDCMLAHTQPTRL